MVESKASGWLSQLQGQVSRRVPEDYREAVPSDQRVPRAGD